MLALTKVQLFIFLFIETPTQVFKNNQLFSVYKYFVITMVVAEAGKTVAVLGEHYNCFVTQAVIGCYSVEDYGIEH